MQQLEQGLTAEEFAALLAKLPPPTGSIAVAVSGGPDSMALAYCLKRWTNAQKIRLQAFIVDHALRPESAAEAQTTHDRLQAVDIPAEILTWHHGAVTSRIHVAARAARYRLLTEACHRHGIGDLFLAHQREDQAETVLMRLAKGSGIDGLTGINPVTETDSIRLLHPLLSVAKERLMATCHEAQISFITDPSNLSDQYARGRLRRVMPLLASEGLTVDRLIDLAERATEARDALDHYTRQLWQSAAKQDKAGTIRFDLPALRAVPRAIASRAVTQGLQTIHRENYAPEHQSLRPLMDAVLADAEMSPRTLHGCLISKTASQMTLMRETANITDHLPVQPGQTVVWDGRWRVTLAAHAEGGYQIRPLGNPPHDVLDRLSPHLRHDIPQGRARSSLPALWLGDQLSLIPALTPDNQALASAVLIAINGKIP